MGLAGVEILPNASSGMASALGESEKHDVMVRCCSDRRVMRPVVRQVVQNMPTLRLLHNGVLNLSIGVIRRGDQLYVGLTLVLALLGVKLCSITGPLEQS